MSSERVSQIAASVLYKSIRRYPHSRLCDRRPRFADSLSPKTSQAHKKGEYLDRKSSYGS